MSAAPRLKQIEAMRQMALPGVRVEPRRRDVRDYVRERLLGFALRQAEREARREAKRSQP